jgi:SAM-dependent methyltransferase
MWRRRGATNVARCGSVREMSTGREEWRRQQASLFLVSMEGQLRALGGGTVLDAGCGAGRNARFLRMLGFDVVCADKNERAVRSIVDFGDAERLAGEAGPGCRVGGLMPLIVDLNRKNWPFARDAFKAIVSIDFVDVQLFGSFRTSLRNGGLLVVESVSGRGGNYLELPTRCAVESALRDCSELELLFYKDRTVGPAGQNAVTLKMMAVKG